MYLRLPAGTGGTVPPPRTHAVPPLLRLWRSGKSVAAIVCGVLLISLAVSDAATISKANNTNSHKGNRVGSQPL